MKDPYYASKIVNKRYVSLVEANLFLLCSKRNHVMFTKSYFQNLIKLKAN